MTALLDHARGPVPSAAAPANVTVHVLNGIAVGWIAPLTTAALAPLPRLSRPAALVAAQPWIFSGNSGGRPSFQKINGQQAADQVRTVLQETNTPGGPQVQPLSSHAITAAISCDLYFYDPCQSASDLQYALIEALDAVDGVLDDQFGAVIDDLEAACDAVNDGLDEGLGDH